jgi:hypothetical protein
METNPIVLVTPIVKAFNMPHNVKQEDSLLNKTEWTQTEVDAFARILDNYIEVL